MNIALTDYIIIITLKGFLLRVRQYSAACNVLYLRVYHFPYYFGMYGPRSMFWRSETIIISYYRDLQIKKATFYNV